MSEAHIFSDIQGAFLVALENGSYQVGVRTRSFPASSSLKARLPPVYQQSMRGTCVANAATALVEYYEDCKARLSVQFLHEMTKSVERDWLDGNLKALSEGEAVDPEFGSRFSNQVAQIRLTSDANGAGSPAAQAFLNAFARQIKSHFGVNSGSSIRHCFSAIENHGICRYSLWPYANIQTEESVPCASFPPGSREDAQKHRILTGLYILRSPNNVDEIRGILAGANARRPMPVCVGLELFEDCDRETFSFPKVLESEGRYVSANTMKGVHEMLIVGYEDDAKAPGGGWFTVRNSWGADWGKEGYGRVPYAYVECFCVEAGTILQDMVDYAGDGYGGMAENAHHAAKTRSPSSGSGLWIALMMAIAVVIAGLWWWRNRGDDLPVYRSAAAQVASGRKVEPVAMPCAADDKIQEQQKRKEEEEKAIREMQAKQAEEKIKREAQEKMAARQRAEMERRVKEEAEAKEKAEAAAREKAQREEELKKLEAAKKALEQERARLAEEKRFAEEKARLEQERLEAERAKRLAEERRQAEERLRREAEAKLEQERLAKEKLERQAQEKRLAEEKRRIQEAAEKARIEAEELAKPVDYVFHMTINCTSEEERKVLLEAMAKVSESAAFRLSDVRSEGKASMWGASRLSVRCDMTVNAPRKQRPNARKMLAEYFAKECRTEEIVDWSHASRILCVQDFSNTVDRNTQQKRTSEGVRIGF